jgi:hypothetical protein
MRLPHAILIAALAARAAWGAAALDVSGIVSRSVANNQANWLAAPGFAYSERDVIVKDGQRTSKTYRVRMIEGWPYNETIAMGGRSLNAAEMKREQQKLQHEIQRRRHESPSARQARIAEYEKEPHQDHALMQEIIKGFVFKLAGTEVMNGHECFRVDASPRPGYVPRTRETKVLTGMRGTLWIDTGAYQWVKVTASVFRPVAFGLFIAQVQPGTEFTLEEAPVQRNIWEPSHFETRVNARVLLWHKNSIENDTFWGYQRAGK